MKDLNFIYWNTYLVALQIPPSFLEKSVKCCLKDLAVIQFEYEIRTFFTIWNNKNVFQDNTIINKTILKNKLINIRMMAI